VVHHYVATDAIEYEYRVNKPPRNTDFERIWERQWIWSYLWIGKEKGLMLVEHIPNIVYVFDFDGYDISHIYTAPPDLWYSEGKTLSPYSLPHTDVESCDGSQSGYVDAHGFIYLYYIDDGTLKRVISEDWGAHWGDGVAVISDQSIEKAFCYEQDGVKICVAIDNSGALKCYRSSTHFDDATWTAGVNVFAIATGITKEAQPCIQFQRGVVYVYAIKDDVVSIHKSEDVGKTWA